MRSDASFDRVIGLLEDARRDAIERLRANPSPDDIALKEQVEWAMGCMRLCHKLGISPNDRAFQIVDPVQTPSARVLLVSDNESDQPALWTELRVDGQKVRLVDGDVVVLKGGR
jgi:hypothetical protein